MKTLSDIIAALRARQVAAGVSDATFAHRLGISRTMWQFIRQGQRTPETKTLQGISTAFPDLAPHIMAFFLPQNATTVTSHAAVSDAEPAEVA